MRLTIIFSLALALFIPVMNAHAISTTANATQTVVAAIAIAKTADLAFGSAPQGDPLKVVAPAAATAAIFNVTGAPNTAYTITLPASVTMITGTGATADTQVVVNTFVSTPAAGVNGMLSAAGTQQLRVGATRAALRATQQIGAYTAAFTVTVIY